VVGSGSYDGSVSARAQIVLWHDEGYPKVKITEMSGASRPTVNKWLKRYEKGGLEALVNLTSPGGPRQIPDRIRGRVLALTRTTPPSALGISHWSSAEMARYIKKTEGVYVSQTWVSRLWRENGLQPWRQGTFKISRDPHFEVWVPKTPSIGSELQVPCYPCGPPTGRVRSDDRSCCCAVPTSFSPAWSPSSGCCR
jgi:transposase